MADDIKLIIDTSDADTALNKLSKVSAAYAALGNAAGGSTNGLKSQTNALNGATAAANKTASAHAGVSRELVVLAHELSQGNFSRFGGSMLVLAEQTNALGVAMKALSGLGIAGGVALASLAAAGGLVAIAMHQAATEHKALVAAIALTNNYTGLSNNTFQALSQTLSGEANISLGKANDILLAIAKTGETTSANIEAMGIAVNLVATLSGEKFDKVAQQFSKINSKPAEFSREMDSMMHIFTPAQLQMVQHLEDTGHTQEATTAALKVFTDYAQGQAASALKEQKGLLDDLTQGWSKLWRGIKVSTGAAQMSIQEMDDRIKLLKEDNGSMTDEGPTDHSSEIAKLEAMRKDAVAADEKAKKDSDQRVHDQLVKNADDYLDHYKRNTTKMQEELEKLHQMVKTARSDPASSGKYDDAYVAQAEAEIRRRYQAVKAPAIKGENTVESTFSSQAADLAKLVDEYNQMNGAAAQTHVAMMQAEIDSGKYKNALTDQIKAELLWRAAAQDKQEALNKQTKAENAEYDAATKQHLAQAQQLTAYRETIVEQQIAREAMLKYGATTDDATVEVDKHRVAQAALALQIGKTAGASDAELQKLQDNLNAAKEKLQLDQDNKDDNDKWTKEQQTFTAGWQKAFNQYKKDAADTSKLGGQLFGDMANGMGNAMATLATTGKLNFSDMINSIIGDLAKWATQELVVIGLEEVASSMGYANGGAFSGGTQFFANGGVVSSTTPFAMSNGRLGIMGEAGPEAIMPLTRGADGKLGVKASGGGGGSPVVNMGDINITMNGSASNPQDVQAMAVMVRQIARDEVDKGFYNATRSGGALSPLR